MTALYLPGQLQLPQTAENSAGLAKQKAAEPLRALAQQLPCDVGLFSDESAQLDLIEMFTNPAD